MSSAPEKREPLVFWGTYDLSKPRVRLLLRAAQLGSRPVLQCHAPAWEGVRDKSQVTFGLLLGIAFKLVKVYPRLILDYLRLPKHSVVVVPYFGYLDVLVLWPFARWRKAKIVWDVFISLYDTVVSDRKLLSRSSLGAKAIARLEWLGTRLADRCFMDTREHAAYLETSYGLPGGSVGVVWVGAEPEHFAPPREKFPCASDEPLRFLFYGQFIPLHGIEFILRAAEYTERNRPEERVEWILIGTGQSQPVLDAYLARLNLKTVRRVPWVDYPELASWIHRADVCLGVFGVSEKTGRVIPNKIFQILAARGPLVTADTPAIRELLPDPPSAVRLVPVGNPEALAEAALDLGKCSRQWKEPLDGGAFPSVPLAVLSRQFEQVIGAALGTAARPTSDIGVGLPVYQ